MTFSANRDQNKQNRTVHKLIAKLEGCRRRFIIISQAVGQTTPSQNEQCHFNNFQPEI